MLPVLKKKWALFKVFMILYFGFRFIIECIKPNVFFLFPRIEQHSMDLYSVLDILFAYHTKIDKKCLLENILIMISP